MSETLRASKSEACSDYRSDPKLAEVNDGLSTLDPFVSEKGANTYQEKDVERPKIRQVHQLNAI